MLERLLTIRLVFERRPYVRDFLQCAQAPLAVISAGALTERKQCQFLKQKLDQVVQALLHDFSSMGVIAIFGTVVLMVCSLDAQLLCSICV
jgi:hypothetical protein